MTDGLADLISLLADAQSVNAVALIIFGIAVTFVWPLWREYLSERRQARAAARMLRGDYLAWQRAIVVAYKSGKWWDASQVQPSFSSVEDIRALAERRRLWAEWAVVGHAYRLFQQLENLKSRGKRPDRDALRRTFLKLEDARRELAVYDKSNYKRHEDLDLIDGTRGTFE